MFNTSKLAPTVLLICAGCTFNADVDVTTLGLDDSSGSTTGEQADTTAGHVESTDAPLDSGSETSAASSSGSDTSAGSSGGSSEDSTTGEMTECMGEVGIIDGHCMCLLDSGKVRAIDPVECGCALEFGPDWALCLCDGQPQIFPACGWACTDITGQCLCGDIAAPAQWCGQAPPLCEGDIEVVDDGISATCMCVSTFGLPDTPLDPSECGCAPVQDECECDGITFPIDTCWSECSVAINAACDPACPVPCIDSECVDGFCV